MLRMREQMYGHAETNVAHFRVRKIMLVSWSMYLCVSLCFGMRGERTKSTATYLAPAVQAFSLSDLPPWVAASMLIYCSLLS